MRIPSDMEGTLVVKLMVSSPVGHPTRARMVTVYSQQCQYAEAQALLEAFWDANPHLRLQGPAAFEMGTVHL